MAKIQNVDYLDLPSHAKQMRSYGKDFNTKMSSAYTKVKNMHSIWFGKRYNEIVKSFNSITTTINEMLQLTVTDIPSNIEKVANNYSQADRGNNATTVDNSQPKKVQAIEVKDDVGMKYLSSDVESVREEISSCFSSAKELMNSFDTEFKKVKWESEAATTFKAKFNSLKESISNSLTDIEKNFKSQMSLAQQDIQKAETANTVE